MENRLEHGAGPVEGGGTPLLIAFSTFTTLAGC